MVGTLQLQRTQEYLTDLKTEIHVIQNAIDDTIRAEAIGRLSDSLEDFNHHRRNLLSSAEAIEWDDKSEQQTYIENLEEELDLLEESLTALVTNGTEPEFDELNEIISELLTRAYGLLEDI